MCFPNVIINVYSWILNIFTVEFCLCWWLNLLVWLVVPSQISRPCFKWLWSVDLWPYVLTEFGSFVITLLSVTTNSDTVNYWLHCIMISCLFKTCLKREELFHAFLRRPQREELLHALLCLLIMGIWKLFFRNTKIKLYKIAMENKIWWCKYNCVCHGNIFFIFQISLT